jgi:hypothetical protein
MVTILIVLNFQSIIFSRVKAVSPIIFCGLTTIPSRYMSSRSKIQFSPDNLKAPAPEIQADYFKLPITTRYVIRIDD